MKRFWMFALIVLLALSFGACATVDKDEKTKFKTTVDGQKSALDPVNEKYREQLRDSLRAHIRTVWEWEQWRDGKLIATWKDGNVCTDQGLDHMLDVYFHGEAASGTWYVLIFESDTTPTTATTYAVPVFTESTAYTEANRITYVEAASSSQTMTNTASKASFSINATKTIYGAALVDNNTKGDLVGAGAVMFCASKFTSGSKSVENGDTLKVTITITASDA